MAQKWTPDSWRSKPILQVPEFPDSEELAKTEARLATYPPLVFAGEARKLKSMLGNVALAARLVPSIGRLRVMRTWAGMNTTLDGLSLLGPVPGAERVILAGPGDAGYTLGPICGRTAACLAMGTTPPIDTGRLTPRRFSA